MTTDPTPTTKDRATDFIRSEYGEDWAGRFAALSAFASEHPAMARSLVSIWMDSIHPQLRAGHTIMAYRMWAPLAAKILSHPERFEHLRDLGLGDDRG